MKVKDRMFLRPTFKVKLSDHLPFHELKYAVRNTARMFDLYFEPVSINVESEVEVNNFGKWLFGVKGFAGHWKNSPADDNGYVIISLPELKEARELVRKALDILRVQGVVEEFIEVES